MHTVWNSMGRVNKVFAKFLEGGYVGVVKSFGRGYTFLVFYCIFIKKFFKNFGERVHFYSKLFAQKLNFFQKILGSPCDFPKSNEKFPQKNFDPPP